MQLSHSRLLQLPMELLQHIASFVDVETGLLHLRLTCRTLGVAAFEYFADEYLANLVKLITASRHLAGKVRKITFTIDPFEHRHSVSLAASNGNHQEEHFLNQYMEDYSRRNMLDEDWRPIQDPACAILIHDIMRNVRRLSKATVCVDALEQDHLDLSLDRYCLTFLNDVLDACVQTGWKIEEASLSDLISPGTDEDSPGDEIYTALAAFDSLKIFRYQQRDALEDVLDLPEEDEIASLKSFLENIMHQSTGLEELHWAAPYDLWSVGYVPCPTPTLFNIDRMDCLRLLSLANMCCSYAALRGSLLACRSTLTTVRFEMLRIEAVDEAWTGILEVLRGMLVLRDISLTHLSQGEGDRTEFLQFLLPGDRSFERHHFVPGREYVDAASFLEWNLEHGLKYQ